MKKYIAYMTALTICASMISLPCINAASDIEIKTDAIVASEEQTPETTTDSEESTDPDKSEEPSQKEETDETQWHISLHKAASATLTDEGDCYKMYIANPGGEENGGADKWDVQFRIKGLSIKEGHKYKMTYNISSDSDGYYYSKIGNASAETVGQAVAGEAWHNQFGLSTVKSFAKGYILWDKNVDYSTAWTMQDISYGDTISVTSEFDGLADLPDAEWTFFLGGKGPATPTGCFEKDTTLYFTNLSLTDVTAGETLVSYIHSDSDATYQPGDIDGNEKTDLSDLTLLSMHLLGDKLLTGSSLKAADVTENGIVDIEDLPALTNIVMHGEN